MTIRELELKLRKKGVPPKLYSLDGGKHFEKYRVLEKTLFGYEVYSIDLGMKHHIYKFRTEDEACSFFYKKILADCKYADIPLNGEKLEVHKNPVKAPKWLHEDMSHIAETENINVTYKRDIHSITFKNGYKFESEFFFEDRFYKNNAIICLNSSNENNGHKNRINIPDNVFMISDKGERIWTFKRSFIFPDRHTPVNHIGISYDNDELYLFVYDDKHYRPQYVLDPETGHLLQRREILFPSWRKSVKITFRRRKNKSSKGKE